MLTLLAFLLTLIIIVGVHELGHYFAARMCGVRVLAFAIGFGRPLLKRTDKHGTEWRFGPIPLGGYVLMLNDPKDAEEAGEPPERSLEGIPRLKRAWVIFAGPLANFLLSIILFYATALMGDSGPRAKIGRVIEDSPAQSAGLVAGDEILEVDGSDAILWSKVIENILYAIGNHDARLVVKSDSGTERSVVLPTGPAKGPELLTGSDLLGNLGLVPDTSYITLEIATVIPGAPAEAAGLKAGDLVVAAGGELVGDWGQFVDAIRSATGGELAVVVARDGEIFETSATLADRGGRGYLGVAPRIDEERRLALLARQNYGPVESIMLAFERTGKAIVTTGRFLRLLLFGSLDTDNLSGPVGIARQSGMAASLGIGVFLLFIAQISVGLGLINLLPIPVLDGGHLLRYAIEGVMRRPLPPKIIRIATLCGVCLLFALTIFTVFNDLT